MLGFASHRKATTLIRHSARERPALSTHSTTILLTIHPAPFSFTHHQSSPRISHSSTRSPPTYWCSASSLRYAVCTGEAAMIRGCVPLGVYIGNYSWMRICIDNLSYRSGVRLTFEVYILHPCQRLQQCVHLFSYIFLSLSITLLAAHSPDGAVVISRSLRSVRSSRLTHTCEGSDTATALLRNLLMQWRRRHCAYPQFLSGCTMVLQLLQEGKDADDAAATKSPKNAVCHGIAANLGGSGFLV